MIRQYVGEALHRASYSVLESNVYCATVAGLPGVIATGATLETCRDQLAEIGESGSGTSRVPAEYCVRRGLPVHPIIGIIT